ncbi:TVP38/TMEM64 family protein [Clostridium estertheticum]|uniref:TVP38/TMEM64 family protein n=1 Tax=Clostridium estertheticum TaxID=238834 RepID=UPI001C0DAE12|nr:TVP38/TMEM64 family protein [Clostridium estertheticum]MBU3179454.1 TVP38/TMEM64 family protein [Clostridium estertheticum]
MENAQRTRWNILINGSTFAGLLMTVLFFIYGIQSHLFTSQIGLQTFLQKFGFYAPIIFIIFQAIQVVLPISPGGIGCVGGILIFGPVQGFIYNYIGICIGSIAAFLLARQYGSTYIKNLSNKKTFNKYIGWLEKPSFERVFAIAIFMPVAPDDTLCYIAGISKMKFKTFVIIILLGKPFAIAMYSLMLNFAVQRLLPFLQIIVGTIK